MSKIRSVMVFILVLLLFIACKTQNDGIPPRAILKDKTFERLIPHPYADPELKIRFNKESLADSVYVVKKDTSWTGFNTSNREFLEDVITPMLEPYIEPLSRLSDNEIINELTLFIFDLYQAYFGQSFYRWGGDLFDLDDPQTRGAAIHKRYGLDCSGFVTAPYELAVHFGLIPDSLALFSTQGYKLYCEETGFQDGGGLDGGPNNYRLDTRELNQLGKEIYRIEKGGSLRRKYLKNLQPGDIAGRNGHYGIIVFIENEPYFLESGGWVVPLVDGYPVKADAALKKFAENRYVIVRRVLNSEF